jgi:N-acyl-D-amino-acid deacylase
MILVRLCALMSALMGVPGLLAGPSASWAQSSTQSFDVLIRNGWVIDGSGNPKVRVDVGIRGDAIVAVTNLDGATAARVIDAQGKYVVPGFIDMHSHADRDLKNGSREVRTAPNLISQGITTVVGGPDGRSGWPIADEMKALADPGIAVNFVPMVGHGTVRQLVMKNDFKREATPEEVAQMRKLVRQGMEEGAWGIGAGPEYSPGLWSSTEELIELAKEVAPYDGFYYAHQRSQSPIPLWQLPSMVKGPALSGTDGMKETIRIGRESGIRVVGSHIKAKGEDMWGQSSIDINLINRAREEGVQVYLDQYPYNTFGGGATGVIPAWGFAKFGTDPASLVGERLNVSPEQAKANLKRNLADPKKRALLLRDTEYTLAMQGGASRHVIVAAPERPELISKTLAEVAAANNRTPVEQLIEFALNAGEVSPSGVLFRPVAGSDFDVENYMRQEYTATSTDAGVYVGARPGLHPRYFGTYPRKIARYARDKGVISLPFAIRSSTALPAQIIGLPDRGYIRVGQKADIVIFDYQAIRDNATIEKPDSPSEGIELVMVNGQVTFEGGAPTGALPGVVLNRKQVRGL